MRLRLRKESKPSRFLTLFSWNLFLALLHLNIHIIEGFFAPHSFSKTSDSRLLRPVPQPRRIILGAGVMFSESELDTFVEWLEGQRAKASIPNTDGPTIHVLDAGYDVDTAILFSGVMWQVLADVSTNCFGPNDCEVIIHFPGLVHLGIEVLEIFEDLIRQVKGSPLGQDGSSLPELQRLDVTKTTVPGPAMHIRARSRSSEEQELALLRREASLAAVPRKEKCQEAVRHFVQRLVIDEKACPYTKSVDIAATSLESQGITPGPVGYKWSPCSDMIDAVSTAWQSFADVINTPEEELSTVLFSLPAVATLEQGHNRFLAFCELMAKSVLAYGTDQMLGLVFFHPLYDRDQVDPRDDASYGHIPPLTWLPPMARQVGGTIAKDEDCELLETSEDARACSNYQRRAPCLVLNVLRATQLTAATGGLSVVALDVPHTSRSRTSSEFQGGPVVSELTSATRQVQASGIRTYARNAIILAQRGNENLMLDLASELNDVYG